MKVVILAGGYGSRISEESQFKPKPMIEIGGMPIIWHIMKIYSYYGFNDFIICAGYKQEYIKRWFSEYKYIINDVCFDFETGENKVLNNINEKWKVTVVNTGLDTMTGGRLKKIRELIDNETFMVTYGDGVGNIDISKLLQFHLSHKKIATISAYSFAQNKGVLEIQNGSVRDFREKSNYDGDLINIGFMVFNPSIFNYLESENTILEKEPMSNLIKDGQLMAYIHNGFWQCMDTLREKEKLEKMWQENNAPWEIWK